MGDGADPADALESERVAGVLFEQRESWLTEQVCDVVLGAGAEIVHCQNVMALREKCTAHVRSKESRPTSDDNPTFVDHSCTPF